MPYALGLKALMRLVVDADALEFHKAKLSAKLFKGDTERQVFEFVHDHHTKYHQLPKEQTLLANFPELKEIECPEPSKYYLGKINERFAYDTIRKANVASQEILKANPSQVDKAQQVLATAINDITEQKYRHRIMDFGLEAKKLVVQTYMNLGDGQQKPAGFGWPYLDAMGGAIPGDVVSFIGRPAMGKSIVSLYIALHNWQVLQHDVLFVSMEMNTLSVAQRAAAMYAHTGLTQLKTGGYCSDTFELFSTRIDKAKEEPAKLYVVDGNLAANVEDVYTLCSQLGCSLMFIDGAYLLRHKNTRLGRTDKINDNVELMKRFSEDLSIPTIASWQFNREATKLDKKKGQKVGVEHIGGSDAIGQVSSTVCALGQDEGVETIQSRVIEVMKGRNGEVGQFRVNWDFIRMRFDQIDVMPEAAECEYL
jgi:replicative DNA helicase